MPLFIAFALAAMSAALVVFYRLSIKLPGVALERRDFGFRDAWRVSAGNNWRILGLVVLFFVTILVIGLATAAISYSLAQIGRTAGVAIVIAVQVMVNWVSTILCVTMLTSLYGFFVEERDF